MTNEHTPDQPETSRQGGAGRGETLARLDQEVRDNPNSDDAWRARGVALRHLGEYEEAERSLSEALRLKPTSVYGLFAMGDLQVAMGQYSEGMATLDKAVALYPGDSRAYVHRGRGYDEQGRVIRGHNTNIDKMGGIR
jgi:Flp pilus assembly protein TadD